MTYYTPAGVGTFERVNFLIDGGGSAITTGLKGYFRVGAGTIVGVSLLADVSGSIVVDLFRDLYSAHPPVVGDSITASAKPTISAATKSEDVTLSGWSVTCAEGDVLGVSVDSCSTMTKCCLCLRIRKG